MNELAKILTIAYDVTKRILYLVVLFIVILNLVTLYQGDFSIKVKHDFGRKNSMDVNFSGDVRADVDNGYNPFVVEHQ